MPRNSARWLVAAFTLLAAAALAAWGLRPPAAVTPTPTPSPTPPPFASGSLVLRLAELRGIGPYEIRVSVYADGRVVTRDPTAPAVVQDDQQRPIVLDTNTPVVLQRRLSSRGLALLTATVDATGLFERSHDVPTQTKSGMTPPAIESGQDLFVRVRDGQRVQVTTASAEDPAWMVHSDERVALNHLSSRLEDLAWLPGDAWADATATLYDGGRWLLFTGTAPPFQDLGNAGPPDALLWFSAFATDPVDIGSPFTSADGVQGVENRCAVVSSRELGALVNPLTTVGFGQAHAWSGSIVLPWSDRHVDLHLAWRLLLPDEAPSCSGKAYPPVIAP